MLKKTKFIAIEGGEGSGKSTLIAAAKEKYGSKLLVSREPGGSPYGEVIRDMALKHPLAKEALPVTMLLLMFASRFDHMAKTIERALKSGKVVISDRFDASSYAYNNFAQAGGELEELFWTLRRHLNIVPDLYIFFDVDPKVGAERVRSRHRGGGEKNHFDAKRLSFHRKIREGYLDFFKRKGIPHVIIDAGRSLVKVEEEFVRIMDEVLKVKGQSSKRKT